MAVACRKKLFPRTLLLCTLGGLSKTESLVSTRQFGCALQGASKGAILEKTSVVLRTEGVTLKTKYITIFVGLIVLWFFPVASSFAQSAGDCTITSKGDSKKEIIISCPDGSRTVDVGGRADLYRVGDRVDIYGMPGNQPAPRPGETPMLGR